MTLLFRLLVVGKSIKSRRRITSNTIRPVESSWTIDNKRAARVHHEIRKYTFTEYNVPVSVWLLIFNRRIVLKPSVKIWKNSLNLDRNGLDYTGSVKA